MQQLASGGMPQQYIPLMYAPQAFYDQYLQMSQMGQQMQQNNLLKEMFQQTPQQQMQPMNYPMPMMQQFGDQFYQQKNVNQGFQQKFPNYSQVKQELEDQQQKNNK
ncbi:unnamed protein product (macronuclear) [Paramecium tetraurelia]|uniref:Uncharacterized protein n=1 Tax=Paramecium tetraurelia TaxID=5888 RepID=A0C138_PARTE|nr:uncharacterized protein GSPATT00033981001 [Paramecium tetraurelia]CAK64505.1 unnamed protein product [Paramecium tetraurelia]|eukprot:XP_001431903.1 hypothetical protein (macronuclear) [Paramecium tetraurelia strain d4-2]